MRIFSKLAMSLRNRLPRCWKLGLVTVEPILFLTSLAMHLEAPTRNAFIYQKSCLTKFDSDVCNHLKNGSFKEEEDAVQSESSRWMFYQNLAFIIPSLFVVLYLGSWSDKISRKLPMILTAIGSILGDAIQIVLSVYMQTHVGFILFSALASGLTGGFVATLMSVFSYAGQVASDRNRTARMGVIEAMLPISGIITTFVSGILLKATSFVFVYSLVLFIRVLLILYVIFLLPDIRNESSPISESLCSRLFNFQHAKDTLGCVFRNRPLKKRTYILSLVLAVFMIMLGSGE